MLVINIINNKSFFPLSFIVISGPLLTGQFTSCLQGLPSLQCIGRVLILLFLWAAIDSIWGIWEM